MELGRRLPVHLPEAMAFKGLGGGMVHLEDLQARQQIRAPPGKGIQSGPQDHVLLHPLLPDGLFQVVFGIARPAEGDGLGSPGLHPAGQGAGLIGTRRRPGRVSAAEHLEVARLDNLIFFCLDQAMRQKIVENFGVVVGGMVGAHKGGTHGGSAEMVRLHRPLCSRRLWEEV